MAGLGSRFSKAGYNKPKPFIDVAGKPMICRVLDNLLIENAKFYLIAQKEHILIEQNLVSQIENDYNAKFIPIDGLSSTIKHSSGFNLNFLIARLYISGSGLLFLTSSFEI